MKRRDIVVGEQIGSAKVLEKVYNEKRHEWEYICECVCGARFKSRKDHLLHGRKGCKNCMGKGSVRIDYEGILSVSEFNERVERKKAEKEQEAREREAVRIEKANERERLRSEIAKKKAELKRILKEQSSMKRLTHSCWIGEKFGRLTVIDSYFENGITYWVCQCDCGNIVTKMAKQVKYGTYVSCGCKSKEIKENAFSNERLYSIWGGIKNRCLNKNCGSYKNYGGRGIKICDEWKNSYLTFKEWAYKNGWTEEKAKEHKYALSIERINVNGNYEPSNCCFIELRLQNKNKRPYSELDKKITRKDKNIITINGIEKSQREWQDFYKISDSMLSYRVKVLGMTIKDAISTPKYDKTKMYKIYKTSQ